MDEFETLYITRGFKPVLSLYTCGSYAEGFDPEKSYQFMRSSWDETSVFKMCEQSPYFNVAGLLYRDIEP